MKKLKYVSGLLMPLAVSVAASAQKVFSVQYENQADVKVFAVKSENQAYLKVFKVKFENQAGENNRINHTARHPGGWRRPQG